MLLRFYVSSPDPRRHDLALTGPPYNPLERSKTVS